jgi:hypothetical protein
MSRSNRLCSSPRECADSTPAIVGGSCFGSPTITSDWHPNRVSGNTARWEQGVHVGGEYHAGSVKLKLYQDRMDIPADGSVI